MTQTDFNFGWNRADKLEVQPQKNNLDVWELCREVERRIKAVTQFVRETVEKSNGGNTMALPSAGGNAPTGTSSRGSGIPRLSNQMLSRNPKEAKIQAVRTVDGRFGTQVVLKLSLDGQTVMWYVDIKKNPNYKILLDRFGQEENDWAGQTILISLETDQFTEQAFPRASFPAEKSRGR